MYATRDTTERSYYSSSSCHLNSVLVQLRVKQSASSELSLQLSSESHLQSCGMQRLFWH